MGQWHKTGCVLCAQNCGLEVEVEDNRIVKVRGDKGNVKSEGYVCRKGMNIANHQHNADRLKYPLKRVGNTFERISWDQAVDEIAGKLRSIVDTYGPRSFAYMGGGGQGCHFEAAFGVRLMRGLGSRYHYSPLCQEFSGMFWVFGRMFGRQPVVPEIDVDETDFLLTFGWNGMQSHQIPQAPRHLLRIAKDPDKTLVVIDPRLSETARIANIHLRIRPGTDALLMRAMIAVILQEGWENREYIEKHTSGMDDMKDLFMHFNARAAVETCGLDHAQVREICRQFATRRSCLRYDLGILMNRHSAVSSSLAITLLAICGRIGVRGGNVFHGMLMPLGTHCDERDPKTWRTKATDFPAIMGCFPPNAMPEEILSEHPERLRAVFVAGAHPLRSYADTTAYENAFKRLDLLVTAELAMTETAALSHYVLPSRSGYESWDGTFFPMTFPGIFFQMRRPIIEPEGEPLELGEIHLRIAEKLGMIPPIPDSLYKAAEEGHAAFGAALMDYAMKEPAAMGAMPFILGKTLGKAMGSVHLAALWGMMQTVPKPFRKNAARAGFTPGLDMGEELFQKIMDHPEGLWIGLVEPGENLANVRTEDGRINLVIPEIRAELEVLDPEHEEAALRPDPEYPFVLMAGRHFNMNANTLMRNPAWNEGKRDCTCMMHAEDARSLGIEDGQTVRVTTEAGAVEIEVEVTDMAHRGHVVIPHGFGLLYDGREYGVNVNRLTKNTNRDWLGTPMHRYVRCRIEPA
ncbi:MAG TPA: molybdopterin-dependent oxidoreductase [Deltaproteobacteria bacterium]|nr:molybdopterin-dependent oxidoreductase [Deltaproteobacteria bacterium]HPR56509.1 molybdopterin-dependent oxidoreductase [Deltaproteobacteria bacterium]HXK46955.1 molybdopterin-dependent oxidoreductase [Deltaproteobacteria bacterium]